MDYSLAIHENQHDAKMLEELYHQALSQNEIADFRSGLFAAYQEQPDNLLYTAWFYRLQQEPIPSAVKPGRSRSWRLAVPLSVVTGLVFWVLAAPQYLLLNHLPYIILLWAPIATLSTLAFLSLTAGKEYRRTGFLAGGLVIVCLYVLLIARGQSGNYKTAYLDLMAIHLPLLCWITLGVSVLGLGSSAAERFTFLIKSIEIIITAGLYLIAGIAFGGITIGLFNALSIQLPEIITRLIYAGGFGLLPVLAVTSTYDPMVTPLEQDFSQGLSRLVATMMRLLLPLTLVVLVVYIVAIPFSFLQPFTNRDVLIVYNVMLFAIMGLLIGATPLSNQELSPRMLKALRNGILAVAALTVLVSVYALSATVYRTVGGGLTINRLTIIGWNVINICLLILLLFRLIKKKDESWDERVKSVYHMGSLAYTAWVIFLICGIPLLFR
jgi:hypothetical protein